MLSYAAAHYNNLRTSNIYISQCLGTTPDEFNSFTVWVETHCSHVELADVANKTAEHPVKLEFQINSKDFFVCFSSIA